MRLVGGLRWGGVRVRCWSTEGVCTWIFKSVLCGSSAQIQQIRAGLKHCSLRGASLITAAVVTTLLKFPAVDCTSWHGVMNLDKFYF